MLRLALGILAAAAAATGAAEARTIVVADVLAGNGGAVDGAIYDLGDVAIRYRAPQAIAVSEPARAGGDFARQIKARVATKTLVRPTYIEIILKGGAKVTNFNFSHRAAGALVANGKSYQFRDVGNLAFKAPVVTVASRGETLALESFDVAAYETPIPAAVFLMASGLVGIGFATRRTKKI